MDPKQNASDHPISSAQSSEQAKQGPPSPSAPDAPRTDLPPEKDPYYEGYFGTEEEAGVEREEDDADASGDGPPAKPSPEPRHS